MRFLTETVDIIDRYTLYDEFNKLKEEKIILNIELVSSGCTKNFKSSDVLMLVLNKLKEIKPNK